MIKTDLLSLKIGDLVRYRYWEDGRVGKVVEIDPNHSVVVESNSFRYRFYVASRMHMRRLLKVKTPVGV